MKYILFEVNGFPAPVLFPDHVPHDSVVIALDVASGSARCRWISAGFASIVGDRVVTHGKSESLNLSSRPEDALYIRAMLAMQSADQFEVVPKIEGVKGCEVKALPGGTQ